MMGIPDGICVIDFTPVGEKRWRKVVMWSQDNYEEDTEKHMIFIESHIELCHNQDLTASKKSNPSQAKSWFQ